MTGSDETSSGSAVAPFLGALAIIVAAVIGIWLMNLFSGDGLTDEQQIALAASGQNDALQRSDYPDLVEFSCAGQLADEMEVLDRQRESVERRGSGSSTGWPVWPSTATARLPTSPTISVRTPMPRRRSR